MTWKVPAVMLSVAVVFALGLGGIKLTQESTARPPDMPQLATAYLHRLGVMPDGEVVCEVHGSVLSTWWTCDASAQGQPWIVNCKADGDCWLTPSLR